MKAILKAVACASALLLAASAFTACSPNDGDNEQVTTTTAVTTTALTTTTNHGSLAASDVIVRSGPGLDYDAIGGITYGEDVTILGKEGDWYRIQFGDQIGYISAQYIDVDDAPNASEMVEGLKTTKAYTTTKAPTTTKAGDKGTTGTGHADKSTTVTTKGATTTAPTDGTGVVTTTTTAPIGIPTVENGIPMVGIVDDF